MAKFSRFRPADRRKPFIITFSIYSLSFAVENLDCIKDITEIGIDLKAASLIFEKLVIVPNDS